MSDWPEAEGVGRADPLDLLQRARAWFERAHAAGWLDEADVARLAAIEHDVPADLFVDQQARPLVVAFFGGTGVGKSTLLNRLAGEAIARTGVERPTSHEATVYVHESVALADLPAHLPIETVRIKPHRCAAHRNVVWIDAPDIDSTAEANRRAALAWLPHVDLVCYVVSPERYRDDAGWHVLRQRGHKHGWIFVLNRWDEGDPRQGEDFTDMLREAGFESPLLLRTCCLSGRTLPSPDEFDQLQAALTRLLEAHGVQELTRLGHSARLQELRAALHAAEKRFGDERTWAALRITAQQRWEATAETIREGAEWSLRAAAACFAAAEGGFLEKVKREVRAARGERSGTAPDTQQTLQSSLDEITGRLWDDWTQSKLVAFLDTAELAARHAEVGATPLRRRIEAVAASAGTNVAQELRDHVRAALARPGTAMARLGRRITGFLMAFLPLVALLWVAWAVVVGYYRAVRGVEPFRGVDLAIHSVLLLAVAWAIPFTVDRFLRPSLERSVLRALRAGLDAALVELGNTLLDAVQAGAGEASSHRQDGQRLDGEALATLLKPSDVRAPDVVRLLTRPHIATGKGTTN